MTAVGDQEALLALYRWDRARTAASEARERDRSVAWRAGVTVAELPWLRSGAAAELAAELEKLMAKCKGCGHEIPADYTEAHPGPYHDSCCPDCPGGRSLLAVLGGELEDPASLLGVGFPQVDADHRPQVEVDRRPQVEQICLECGDDLAAEGYPLCVECLETSSYGEE